MKVKINIEKEKKCLHKNQFHKMVYPLKPNVGTQELNDLDITKPEIETICADCGLWLKSIKVKKFIK